MFDGLFNLIAGALNSVASILPDWKLGIDLSGSFRTIAELIELIGYMFPPIILTVKLLGIWLGLEIALWALYAINWLIKKIPLLG